MTDHIGVGEAVRRLAATEPRLKKFRAHDLSEALYRGRLDGARCPVVAGRRLIPVDYLPEIVRVLTRKPGRQAREEAARS